jgi:hypothetical protein
MKYMLLIQHGDMPRPGSPEWDALSPQTSFHSHIASEGVGVGVPSHLLFRVRARAREGKVGRAPGWGGDQAPP